jgi:aerobic-type carbon monoxide dehydrogenase small subunit (CoxS/CutS family)
MNVRINGTLYSADAEPRTLLSDFIRHELGLTGTKVGCEHGVCGACTVQLDGEPVRSCLMLAIQADGKDITTIEGLENQQLKDAFHEHHALQCGFCTAGILLTLDAYLREHPAPTETQVREALAGNLCRCTGYRPIVEAVLKR